MAGGNEALLGNDAAPGGQKKVGVVAVVSVLVGGVGTYFITNFASAPKVCQNNDMTNCPWDYKGFHTGDWHLKGYPLCDGQPRADMVHNDWQSPINIPYDPEKVNKSTNELVLSPAPGGCQVVATQPNAHTFQVGFNTAECANKATWKGRTYTLQQFHFHSESETTLNMRHQDGEVHLVHKSEDGHGLVIGAFMKEVEGDAPVNAMMDELFKMHLNKKQAAVDSPGAPLDPYGGLIETLPQPRQFISYLGSLTTPPCTPNVEWVSFRGHVHLRPGQLATFREYLAEVSQPDAYHNDNRPIQPVNGRVLESGVYGGK